jgi:hypothetical protein
MQRTLRLAVVVAALTLTPASAAKPGWHRSPSRLAEGPRVPAGNALRLRPEPLREIADAKKQAPAPPANFSKEGEKKDVALAPRGERASVS